MWPRIAKIEQVWGKEVPEQLLKVTDFGLFWPPTGPDTTRKERGARAAGPASPDGAAH